MVNYSISTYFFEDVLHDAHNGTVGGECSVLALHIIEGGFVDVEVRHHTGSQTAVLAPWVSSLMRRYITIQPRVCVTK